MPAEPAAIRSRTLPPPIIHIMRARSVEVSEAADRLALNYTIAEVAGRADIVEFRFRTMGDELLLSLIGQIPLDAFAYRAIVGKELP
jgi:hypothetical protein